MRDDGNAAASCATRSLTGCGKISAWHVAVHMKICSPTTHVLHLALASAHGVLVLSARAVPTLERKLFYLSGPPLVSMAPQLHVPAWKRVGLKLKRPAETANDQSSAVDTPQTSKKRKLNKPQPNGPSSSSSSSTRSSHVGVDSSSPLVDSNSTSVEPDSAKKRRSVTFSHDAKSGDGPSQASAPTSPSTSAASHEAQPSVEQASAAPAPAPTPTPPPPSRKSPARMPHTESEPQPYLRYLRDFCDHNHTWKFNKNLQSQLLASLFDLERVPESWNPKLRRYLYKLRGASRWRMEDEAMQILCQTESSAADSTNQSAQAVQGIASQPPSLEALKHTRAQLVLSVLQSGGDDRPDPTTTPTAMFAPPSEPSNAGRQRQGKRSRGRQRRAALDAASSSSSSSSSDSSDSDSDSES